MAPRPDELPMREQRKQCWGSRDAWFACLDKNNIINPIDEEVKAKKACPKEFKKFEDSCVHSWVEYFNKKRVLDFRKEQMLREAAEKGQLMTGPAGSFSVDPNAPRK
ncbi:hypothetical protein SAICODRAFT_29708 [Saitoella complicata NRRL Y-17804]|uniref:Cytochrome c oxidase assembly factor 6 n=1 Tax=Saitoella complicata (strain BCRC 22490 / CBS 7301 / JCM 7358 / NBRC 10748 / NRRL Y-17804) TaxID=698492 RepID=A0A0E9NHC0_SAICN|nr:uncharacterized protein SAICODRAFT_29708 [Saitoella complicata NRRL Y-17804]ODQ54135.1 hypothetical protein SAICODRAFT_29708 [Saitoella complicata NRRL Y-17804]GAO49208.1 hypothetical protein G7K_3366-t1 [Saitoella complicata NRRL Y-17804]